MTRGLLTFDLSPNPAKEGQSVTIALAGYPSDRTTLTLMLVNWNESITKQVKIEIIGGKGKTTFVIPKGWGPSLFVNHKSFYTEAIAVEP